MKKITANIFKNIPDKYITIFIDSNGRLLACNQKLLAMKTRGCLWVFDNINGLDLLILGEGYDAIDWRKSAIERPNGVIGREIKNKINSVFIKKTPKIGFRF